jgi:hypothetical protein
MDVGDSFLIPTLKPMGILYIIDTRAKAAGYKIRTSIVIEGDILGVRVWRVD